MTSQVITIHYEQFDSPDALGESEKGLITHAISALPKAYAPYSKFAVGAAVLTKSGQIIVGSNQETANFKGSCAEKVALDSTGALGFKSQIQKIAIVGGAIKEGGGVAGKDLVMPCGQCRQDLKEVEDVVGEPLVLLMAAPNKVIRITGIENLLPFAFGPRDLKG